MKVDVNVKPCVEEEAIYFDTKDGYIALPFEGRGNRFDQYVICHKDKYYAVPQEKFPVTITVMGVNASGESKPGEIHFEISGEPNVCEHEVRFKATNEKGLVINVGFPFDDQALIVDFPMKRRYLSSSQFKCELDISDLENYAGRVEK
jgi:hypothetical protein